MKAARTEDEERFKTIVKIHLKLKSDGKSSEGHLLEAIAKHLFNIRDHARTYQLYDEANREFLGADIEIVPIPQTKAAA